ncbi:MAG: UDP-N-acetylglucosamine--N-acetylmuramyl-(pentapeptide) pyrophosphoryl-undecaprenol N-acetylglucosamine transferase [Anaerolineae bacterium]|nr:UDP-N-acetylglucosamine--N-acetylmuramyl-(pentapeptide) pyrophosphoryl-undecaprenol N-acetylglucosamine transferase [Anaerolineae bacterium]
MRILIAAGGTGGHVYPALAIAEAIESVQPGTKLAFVGSVGGFERPLIAESGVQFERQYEVYAGPLHGVSPLRIVFSLLQIVIGTLQAVGLILSWRPQALLLTGGWVGLPVGLAAWLLRVPGMIYLPDIEPGLAIQVLRRLVRRVAITAPESARYFPAGQTVATGYPLRRDVMAASRDTAQAHFTLDPRRKTLLVFGGSRGARTINTALLDVLPALMARPDLQIIHVTGTLDWDDIDQRRKTMGALPHYHAFPYLHREMGLAFAAADLVLSRAGASILGEFPFFGLPAILVPYPYAWRYQKVNADFLAGHGAAIVMNDADMGRDLLCTIETLLDDPSRLAQMQTQAKALAQPDGARRAAEALMRLATGEG